LAETFPEDCGLYTPGHKTHFIQTRVKADLPRFPATVELIDLETIAIQYNKLIVLLKTHDAPRANFDALNVVDSDITFAPEANLLYIKTDGPSEGILGRWRPYYLSDAPLTDCSAHDPNSGYFPIE
jgi:hypothetical protein